MTIGTVPSISGRDWPHRKAVPGLFLSDPMWPAVVHMLQNAAPRLCAVVHHSFPAAPADEPPGGQWTSVQVPVRGYHRSATAGILRII